MNIEELLDSLLHKVYGKEVRQGFVDSIRQCYKDATGNPESVAAVVKLLNDTPYTTYEEGESSDLPIHAINDDETSLDSTWSSEKINTKLDEVFQSASNGKNTLAAAIGNGATADMTWSQLADKTLKINHQYKTGTGTVYFDKAYNTVLIWVIIGENYGSARTGFVKTNDLGESNAEYLIKDIDSDASYGISSDGRQAYAKTPPSNTTHNECYYNCYQIGYN